jgi:transmembrane sensor
MQNMLKNEFHISELIAAYLREDISTSELEELNAWIAKSEANLAFVAGLNKEKELSKQLKAFNEANETAVWDKTMSRLKQKPVVKRSLFSRFPVYKIAAAAIILVTLTFSLYLYKEKRKNSIVYANDIAPGKVGATLTLSNGKKIKLTESLNGEIAKESGISITKNAAGELIYFISNEQNSSRPFGGDERSNSINTLSTAKGETYIIVLPDQSKVWMNAASSLTYSATLNDHGMRKVKLDGEAYFEVAKDKAHPFIVESNGQQVEVLGTHFNVNSYNDEESVKTTLIEGSVRVSSLRGMKQTQDIKPGQQASLLAPGNVEVADIETELFTAWKDNKFIFDNSDIKSVMRIVQRWYNVDVVYLGQLPDDNFGGKVSRFDNVSSVLRILESTGGVHFKIEGRKIYVSK